MTETQGFHEQSRRIFLKNAVKLLIDAKPLSLIQSRFLDELNRL